MLGNLGTGLVSATTTYSVAINETGLPSGTSWTAVFNGVTNSGTGTSLTYSGLSAGSYCYTVTSPVSGSPSTTRYAAYSTYGCITVPNQLTVTDPFTTQYSVTFGVTPVSSGSAYPGTNWYTNDSTIEIQSAATYGYAFHDWTATKTSNFVLAVPTRAATELTVLGTGTVTAHFNATKYATTFTEVGLPTGTAWSVVYGGTSYLSSTSTVATGSHGAGSIAWTVASVALPHGVSYAASPASGSMSVPYLTTQTIVFVKQFSVTIATNPASSGSTTPGVGSAYYTNGTNLPITAWDSGTWQFSGWSSSNAAILGINSKTTAGTNATIAGTGTLTAKFVSGTACTTCSLTFYEVGLPTGTGWGVGFNGNQYTTKNGSIAVTGLTAAASWSAYSPLGSGQYGVQYYPESQTASGYWYFGETASITFVYVKEYYVTMAVNPQYSGAGVSYGSGWYVAGSQSTNSAVGTASYKFSSWTASNANLTLTAAGKASTAFTVKGPATLTANFVVPTATAHYVEYGLPKGTTWGVSLSGQNYYSASPWINVTGVPYGSYGWSASTTMYGGKGVQWDALDTSGGIAVPTEAYVAVVYAKEFQVTFQTGGTVGGTISPSGTAYYLGNTILPLMAENGTGVPFSAWSKTVTTGTITFSSTKASTYVTIDGAGTVTGTFT
ncbi:MAG: hypothetical protein L3K16_08145 [Thermoplasmata archaeon]|nr:hypothetical protein [Thermoplasmata archaeon]